MLGNAALSLDWVECRRKICLFERVPRRIFIQSSSSHVRLLLGGACWLNAVKIVFDERAPRRLFVFDAKAIQVDALSINCDRILCFSKERQGAYFCSTYIEGSVLSRIYGLNSICRVTFAVNLYYIWVHYYICAKFLLHLWGLLRQFLHLWLQGENQRCSIF